MKSVVIMKEVSQLLLKNYLYDTQMIGVRWDSNKKNACGWGEKC